MSGSHAAHFALLQAIYSMSIVVQLKPQAFLSLLEKNEAPMVLTAKGGFIRKHYRYLTTYKGFTFFTKVYEPLMLPKSAEIIEVGRLRVPYEAWRIWDNPQKI